MQFSQLLHQQCSQVCFALYLVRKLNCRQTPSGSAAISAHVTATAMHFPANAGRIFLTDVQTNDRYLVDTGATLSIVPCRANSRPSGPLLKWADGHPILSWGFIKKTAQFQDKLFTSSFLEAAVAGPILGIDFLRKFKVTCSRDQHYYTASSSGSTSSACLDNFFPAFCHIHTCSPESRGEVVQLSSQGKPVSVRPSPCFTKYS